MTFVALGLSEPLVRVAAQLGFAAPTPVQTQAIPAILRGRDVWASAPTGSGKTAAFVLPLLDVVARRGARAPRTLHTLVLVPTRELAAQILQVIESVSRTLATPIKACLAVGGGSVNPQLLALRGGADIVVATPGRLLDLVDKNGLALGRVATLVLDEADRMLSLGFADELARVLALLPARRQNLLLSATFPPAVQALAQALLVRPTRIAVAAGEPPTPAVITQRAILVDAGKRTPLLRHLIERHGWAQVLVFVASGHRADHVATKLRRVGLPAASLHGGLSQGARTQALADFKAGRLRVLVATDLAARGLDVVGLPAVVSYELPRSAVDHQHRVGRTGRAGAPGVAVSFIGAEDRAHFDLIEKRNRLRLDREQLQGFEPSDVPEPGRDVHGGVKGRRPSKKDKRRALARTDTPAGDPVGAGSSGAGSSGAGSSGAGGSKA